MVLRQRAVRHDWNHERHRAVEQPELAFAQVQVYNSSLSLVGQAGTTASLAATATVSTKVEPGQEYYIKVLAAGGPGPIGGYGLLVNFDFAEPGADTAAEHHGGVATEYLLWQHLERQRADRDSNRG